MNDVKMTDCELVVMKCIWTSDHEMALPEIVDMVNDKYKREWKSQTVSTFLARLVKKGFLTLYRNGRQFYYVPLVKEVDYKTNELEECLMFWCNNNLIDFMETIRKKRPLSSEEIEWMKKNLK